MSPQPTVDLDYADPPVPADLLERVRGRGRLIRRRRRIGTAAGALGLVAVAVVALSAQSRPGGLVGVRDVPPAGQVSPQELLKLPASIGKGPSAAHFTSDGYTTGVASAGADSPAGPVTVMAPAQGELDEQLMWITKDARLALGSRKSPTATPSASLSMPLNNLPGQGLWGDSVFSDNSVSPWKAGPARSFIVGLVRGPVTAVLIDLPGGARPANLVTPPNPELGSLYWLATDVFDSAGTVTAEAADPAFGTSTQSLKRTVYRGHTPVFHCEAQCGNGM